MLPIAPPILVVPGLNGSGPDHWQSLWVARRHDARRVEQDDWDDPHPKDWLDRIGACIRDAEAPVILVAHSLGCAAVARWAADAGLHGHVAGALLVAPCDVERPGSPEAITHFAPMPRAVLPFPATVVASRDDPYVSLDRARDFARSWKARFVDVGALGHINAASGLGEWTAGQQILDGLIENIRASRSAATS